MTEQLSTHIMPQFGDLFIKTHTVTLIDNSLDYYPSYNLEAVALVYIICSFKFMYLVGWAFLAAQW